MTETPEPTTPEPPVRSNICGHATYSFVEQFRGRPTHGMVALLAYLVPMHGDCTADAVAALCAVPGVNEVRLINPAAILTQRIITDDVRCALAQFPVRTLRDDDDAPQWIVLERPGAIPHGDGAVRHRLPVLAAMTGTHAQDDLRLDELVDQALEYLHTQAPGHGHSAALADVEQALRCDACGRIIAGDDPAGTGRVDGDACAVGYPRGGVAGGALTAACTGRLADVYLTVAPAAATRTTVVHSVWRPTPGGDNAKPGVECHSVWAFAPAARAAAGELNDAGAEPMWRADAWPVRR